MVHNFYLCIGWLCVHLELCGLCRTLQSRHFTFIADLTPRIRLHLAREVKVDGISTSLHAENHQLLGSPLLKSACIRKFRGRGTCRTLTQLAQIDHVTLTVPAHAQISVYHVSWSSYLAMSSLASEERLLELPVMDIQPNWNELFR